MYPHTELAFLPWESPIYPDGAALLSLQHKCFDVPILPQFKDLPGEKLTEIQTKTIQHNLSNIALPVHFFDIIPTTEAYIESNFYISSDTSSLNYVAAKEQFFSAA
jgi:hypothetical protein